MIDSNNPSNESERVPPRERFAPIANQFDLKAEAEKLMAEEGGDHSGHRQIALYKHDQATVALFCFKEGGFLKEHQAPGKVFIQVIEGSMTFMVEDVEHALTAGGLLVLAPGTPHDARAVADSIMLLTVCLDKRSHTEQAEVQPDPQRPVPPL